MICDCGRTSPESYLCTYLYPVCKRFTSLVCMPYMSSSLVSTDVIVNPLKTTLLSASVVRLKMQFDKGRHRYIKENFNEGP